MSSLRYIAIGGGVAGAAAGLGFLVWKLLTTNEHSLKDIMPDEPISGGPDKTGYKLVDKILDKLRASAQKSGIPLGLMVGWIAKESGGKLSDTTSLDERGYYQLMPSESKSLGLDHQRLSTDSDYSIDAGVQLIRHYQSTINDLNVANAGTSYYWRLVKLAHSMGAGQVRKVVTAAKAAGQAGSWGDLEDFATAMSINGPQPKKWFPFVDLVYKVGRPFGFGSEAKAVVGLDGLDLLGCEVV